MDVAAWLRGLGLEQYAPVFGDNGIDMQVLPKLTAEDLKDLGITMVGHRRILLEAIAKRKKGDLAGADADLAAAKAIRAGIAEEFAISELQ